MKKKVCARSSWARIVPEACVVVINAHGPRTVPKAYIFLNTNYILHLYGSRRMYRDSFASCQLFA